MALELVKELSTGVMGNYWSIRKTLVIHKEKYAEVQVDLYLNHQSKLDGKNEIFSVNFAWTGTDFPFTVDAMAKANVIAIAYDKIKLLPEWSGAKDV